MQVKFRIVDPVWRRLREHHLANGKAVESLSYIFAQTERTPFGLSIIVGPTAPLVMFGDDCFSRQSGGNVRLHNDVLNAVLIEFAGSSFNTLINVHDHWFDSRTSFSSVDDDDDRRFDAYLRSRFEPMLVRHDHIGQSRDIFNVACVLSLNGMDARLVDTRMKSPFVPVTSAISIGETLKAIDLGRRENVPSRRTATQRHSDFIDGELQGVISRLRVGLVGCGGLGSIFAEGLGRLGFGSIVLVDGDDLEDTNLNRWQGASPDMVGRAKAGVLRERMSSMFPSMEITAVPKPISDPASVEALAGCDLAIGGVDNGEARYFLNRVAVQYCVPYFDAGVSVRAETGNVDFLLRMFAVLPGTTACAECSSFDIYNRAEVKEAFLDPLTTKARRAAGYVRDKPDVATPSVYALNLQASGVLLQEVLNYVCGWRPATTVSTFRWRAGSIQRCDRENFSDGPDLACPTCQFFGGVASGEPLPKIIS